MFFYFWASIGCKEEEIMLNFMTMVWATLSNKKGQGMVEYVLLIGLIAVAVIAIMITMGTTITAEFQAIINSLTAQ